MGYAQIAAVDLGSNSFRLEVGRVVDDQIYPLDTVKEPVRLASGLDAAKNLDAAAQQRALRALALFGERLRGFQPGSVRAVATNTLRVAKNARELLPAFETALGFPIEVIGGREEARLIYIGAVHELPATRNKRLIVDIGGGSTEFVIGHNLQPDITESLPLGCVTYSLRYFPNQKVTAGQFRQAVTAARMEIQRIGSDLKNHGWDLAIGTSGSARAIRDVIAEADEPLDGIDYGHMQALLKRILDAGNVRKAKLPGLKPDRVDVFIGGLAVMMAVFEELNIQFMSITDAALRDGVFYDLIGRQINRDMRDDTVVQFKQRYHVDRLQAQRVEKVAVQCMQGLAHSVSATDLQEWLQYVRWAARLHEIGLSIAHTGYHKHAAYILEHADMPGFSRKEQHILSLLVLGHRGDIKKLTELVHEPACWFGILSLRLAALFCRGRTEVHFPAKTTLAYAPNKKKCVLSISREWLEANPLTASALEQEAEQWAKIGRTLMIQEQ